MQLNDILEENSVRAISQKTKISEDNLENLLNKNFDALKKIKTLGFISIIEREYNADLNALREEAKEYYGDVHEDQSVTLGRPIMEEKKGKSKFFMLVIFALLGYATWYFLTQFDKKNLSELIPFIDESTIESFIGDKKTDNTDLEDLSIAKVSVAVTPEEKVVETVTQAESTAQVMPATSENSVEHDTENSVEVTQTVEDITPQAVTKKIVSIVPVNRLWFGIVNADTFARENFSVSEPYELDVSAHGWLLSTSSAAFSLQEDDETKEFNDAKEHYFKIDANGIKVLTKSDYVALGGWPQW
ncbi:MAG: hypothetical protein FAF03_12250 [Epsilonproteobacteria bacterium]|nr:hypothetical protein [Campylobacterota bacterium]